MRGFPAPKPSSRERRGEAGSLDRRVHAGTRVVGDESQLDIGQGTATSESEGGTIGRQPALGVETAVHRIHEDQRTPRRPGYHAFFFGYHAVDLGGRRLKRAQDGFLSLLVDFERGVAALASTEDGAALSRTRESLSSCSARGSHRREARQPMLFVLTQHPLERLQHETTSLLSMAEEITRRDPGTVPRRSRGTVRALVTAEARGGTDVTDARPCGGPVSFWVSSSGQVKEDRC